MATLAERILEALAGEALDDDMLAARLGVVRQQVNATCRRLEVDGRVIRFQPTGAKILNRLATGAPASVRAAPPVRPRPDGLLSEDLVKQTLKEYLEADGWTVAVAWGRTRGIDLDARRGDEHWIIEAKGEAPAGPQQVNYFLGAIGELVQRMTDDTARCGLALPDHRQYRGLIARLPAGAWRRLSLGFFFVSGPNAATDVHLVEAP